MSQNGSKTPIWDFKIMKYFHRAGAGQPMIQNKPSPISGIHWMYSVECMHLEMATVFA